MSTNYGLVISFPDQSESFVNGFESGMFWEFLKSGGVCLLTMHTANEEVFLRIARHYGRSVEFKRLGDGWSEAKVTTGTTTKLHAVK